MLTKKLYVGTMIAFRGGESSVTPGYTIAERKSHAFGEMLSICKNRYPSEEGWNNHQAYVGKIPAVVIKQVCKPGERGDGGDRGGYSALTGQRE